MDKDKRIYELSKELNDLSDDVEKNRDRMIEIAKILKGLYMPKKKDKSDEK